MRKGKSPSKPKSSKALAKKKSPPKAVSNPNAKMASPSGAKPVKSSPIPKSKQPSASPIPPQWGNQWAKAQSRRDRAFSPGIRRMGRRAA